MHDRRMINKWVKEYSKVFGAFSQIRTVARAFYISVTVFFVTDALKMA